MLGKQTSSAMKSIGDGSISNMNAEQQKCEYEQIAKKN